MGLLGEYVDVLPDEAKDRIIRAQEWGRTRERDPEFVDVLDQAEANRGDDPCVGWIESWRIRAERLLLFGPSSRSRLRGQFERLLRRYGTERVVRLIKLRAARRFMPREGGRHREPS